MWLITLVFISLGTTLYAQVRPAHIFDNNMVLQRDKPVKVLGMAGPQERVKIEFAGQVKANIGISKHGIPCEAKVYELYKYLFQFVRPVFWLTIIKESQMKYQNSLFPEMAGTSL